MIRAGIIGAGFIGPAHVEAVRRLGDVEVVAIAASSQSSAEAKARALSIPRAYGDWHDLVRDCEVQVVHNCTPNVLHRPVTLATLAAGKHIVAEKPLGMNAREAAELLRAIQASDRVGAVCFNYRMYPMTQEARARVAAGELGELNLVHGCYLQDWLLYDTDYNWRLDAVVSGASRAIADIGSHWCDLAEFVSGRRIAAVCADLATFLPRRWRPSGELDAFAGSAGAARADRVEMAVDTEDYGSVLLRFQGGAHGTCIISQISGGHKNHVRLEVNGSRGSLAWEQQRPEDLWLGRRDAPSRVLPKDASLLSPAARLHAHYPAGHGEGYPDSFRNLLGRVYEFIRSGADPRHDPADFPTFEDGLRSATVVEAILASQQAGGWVEVAG